MKIENTPFYLETKDDIYAIKNNHPGVVAISYTIDENGAIDTIGVVTEENPHFPNGTYTGLVMGTIEKTDSSLLQRVQDELKEEAGYDITDIDKWSYLGELYTSKLFVSPLYCYAVDVTGAHHSIPKGDGSEQEKTLKFKMINLSEINNIQDSILQSCFFKLFSSLHKEHFNNGTQHTEP